MKTLLLASALCSFLLVAGLFGSPAASPIYDPEPYRAFCRVLWLFGLSCSDVANKLVHQIREFNPLNGCKRCNYTLVSATEEFITAQHTSKGRLQIENLEFTLHTTLLTGSCRVSAESASVGYSSLLDGGLNYCNLYTLLNASGLDTAEGFMEMTSEWACLGYGFATCRSNTTKLI